MTGFLYVLHFDTPISHAAHYTGSTLDPVRRLADHARGTAARITQVLHERGIDATLVRLIQLNDCRTAEQTAKAAGHGPRLCPLCSDDYTPLGLDITPRPHIKLSQLRNATDERIRELLNGSSRDHQEDKGRCSPTLEF